jgi:tRNA (mo5U34)-methyltransferase
MNGRYSEVKKILETVMGEKRSNSADSAGIRTGAKGCEAGLEKIIPRLLFEEPSQQLPESTEQGPAAKEIALLERIKEHEWYHSIRLGEDIVTRGLFDLNDYLPQYGIPDDLSGKRVLDVATFDGFWAFEFEKRGASEVVAVDVESYNDLDLHPFARAKFSEESLKKRKIGNGFEIAREVLDSKVRKEIMSVYDLSPERLGTFDLVFSSDLLIHLTNPIKALQGIRSVTGGTAFIAETYDPELDRLAQGRNLMQYYSGFHQCVWWMFGLNSLLRMITDASFSQVQLSNTFVLRARDKDDLLNHAVCSAVP